MFSMKNGFLNNIRRGLGRAYLELYNSDNRDMYFDTVLYACLHDCAYDMFFEGPKSDYLYKMVKLFNVDQQRDVLAAIVDSLSIKDNHSLTFQKLELLMEYFHDGFNEARNHIFNHFLAFASETKKWTREKIDTLEIIAIEIDKAFSLKGTKQVIKFIMEKHFDPDEFGWYVFRIARRYKKDKVVKEFVEKFSVSDSKKKEKIYTLDELRKSIDKAFITSFPYHVSKEEFNNVISFLYQSDNITDINKVLSAYQQREIKQKLPLDLCLGLLRKFGKEIETEIYKVIEYYNAKEVEKLGLGLIKTNEHLTDGLIMLFNNYNKKYKNLIVEAYLRIPFSFNRYFAITSETITFMNHKRKNYPDEILLINFEKSYDSFNREYIFDVMKKRNLLTEDLINECLYDYDYELKAKASKIIRSRIKPSNN